MNSIFSPRVFVRPVLAGYLGNHARVLGLIKQCPEDFIVQERQPSHLCTIGPEPNLTEEQIRASTGSLVGATLVLYRLTSPEGSFRAAKLLGIKESLIDFAGFKDRSAITAQRVTISGVTPEQVQAISHPANLTRQGFFLKDICLAEKPLQMGHLRANNFNLRVRLPGMSKEQIEAYVSPLVKELARRRQLFPNSYNRQRLGGRQMNHWFGYVLMTRGAEAAFKEYLTLTSDLEKPAVTEVRKKLLEAWTEAEHLARDKGESVAQQHGQFHTMLLALHRHAELNLANENILVKRILQYCDFTTVLRKTKKKIVGLWIGAYQSLWFNRALEKFMNGEFDLDWDGKIPLYIKDKSTEDWYRARGLSEAIPDQLDPVVKDLFLTVRPRKPPDNERGVHARKFHRHFAHRYDKHRHSASKHRNQQHAEEQKVLTPGPRRHAFISVDRFSYEVDDECWTVHFELESGGYATSVLQMFVDLDTGDEDISEEAA